MKNDIDLDLGNDLKVRTTRRGREDVGVGGQWATGTIARHRFQALVFPGHASYPDYEVEGDSRISKLWVERTADGVTVYEWDRGMRIPAADARATAIVSFLAAGLAEHVYGH